MRLPRATRHILVDTLGLVLHALVTAADVQDRDGGILLLTTLFGQFPFLRKLFAGGPGRPSHKATQDGANRHLHAERLHMVLDQEPP